MKNKYSQKQLEEIYCCEIIKESGTSCCYLFYTAIGKYVEQIGGCLFSSASGATLHELHQDIRESILAEVEAKRSE